MKRRAVGVKRPFEKEAQTYSFCQGKSRFMAKSLEDKLKIPIFAT